MPVGLLQTLFFTPQPLYSPDILPRVHTSEFLRKGLINDTEATQEPTNEPTPTSFTIRPASSHKWPRRDKQRPAGETAFINSDALPTIPAVRSHPRFYIVTLPSRAGKRTKKTQNAFHDKKARGSACPLVCGSI